jgi:hypothetical protein
MACLSLNDQAFIFITMTFPSFITTGGTVDIPTVPLERKSLDLTPLIQQLMMNKKTSATSPTTKKDEKDPEVKGTTGQVEQWYDLYDKNSREMQGLISYYGAEVATTRPEYRQLVNERNQLESVKQRLLNNKEDLDAYDALVKEKGASGLIHLDMLTRTGYGMSHGDWSSRMNYGQLNTELKVTNPNLFTWQENFSFAPNIKTKTDALSELRKMYEGIGVSSWANGGGASTTKKDMKDDWVFLATEHNTWLNETKSNNNIYGENPTKIGQLEQAKRQALQNALQKGPFSGIESNDMKNGFVQDFLSLTAATVSANSIGIPGGGSVKTVFKEKVYNVVAEGRPSEYDVKYTGTDGKFKEAEYKKDYEEWEKKNEEANKTYFQTHDGYYWKAGQKDANGKDIGGNLDEASLTGDYEKYIDDIISDETGKRLITQTTDKSDQVISTTATDTWQNDHNDKLAAEKLVNDALERSFSIAVEGDYGIPEADMLKLLNNNQPAMDELFNIMDYFTDPEYYINRGNEPGWGVLAPKTTTTGTLNELTYSEISPFIVTEDPQSGKKLYKANPNFTGDAIEAHRLSMKEYATDVLKYTEAEAERYSKEKSKEARKAHKTITDNNLARGVAGQVVYDGTKTEITVSDPETWSLIENSWLEMVGTEGKKVGKTAETLLSNQLVQVGLTVDEGASLLGPLRFLAIDEGYSFVNFGLASNAGAKLNTDITIKGKTYKKGQFIHMSQFDAIGQEETKKLVDAGSVDFGPSGFWNTNTMTPGRPNKTGAVSGMGTVSGKIISSLHASGSSNISESATSITATTDWSNEKTKVLDYWKNNRTSLNREVPAFAHDAVKKKMFDEAENIASAYGMPSENNPFQNQTQAAKQALKIPVKEMAAKMKITDENSAAYKKLANALTIQDEYKRKIAITEAIAIRDNISGFASWDVTKKAVKEEIVGTDGKVKDWAKKQLYYQEEIVDGQTFVKVTTNTEIQSQVRQANSKKLNTQLKAYDKNKYDKDNSGTKLIKVNPYTP